MKTKIITGLKKEVLVIELPEGYNLDYTYYSEDNETEIAFYLNEDCVKLKTFKGSFTLLGKPDEIKEDDAKELVESWESVAKDGTMVYENYKNGIPKKRTALESFNSALESEIYWENPISKQLGFIGNVSEIDKQIALQKQNRRFDEAQEKTFDKNRTLIFVKD